MTIRSENWRQIVDHSVSKRDIMSTIVSFIHYIHFWNTWYYCLFECVMSNFLDLYLDHGYTSSHSRSVLVRRRTSLDSAPDHDYVSVECMKTHYKQTEHHFFSGGTYLYLPTQYAYTSDSLPTFIHIFLSLFLAGKSSFCHLATLGPAMIRTVLFRSGCIADDCLVVGVVRWVVLTPKVLLAMG